MPAYRTTYAESVLDVPPPKNVAFTVATSKVQGLRDVAVAVPGWRKARSETALLRCSVRRVPR
jgi:hypothetical protein